MSLSSHQKEVQFLSKRSTSNWGIGGWSLVFLFLSIGLGLYAFNKTDSDLACVYNLCTGPLVSQDSTNVLVTVTVGLILWFGSILMGVLGCVLRSNTIAAGVALFISLAPTVYVVLELIHFLFGNMVT